MNLEVPIELTGTGFASSSAAAVTFARSRVTLNTALYDGVAAYLLEVVGINTHATIAYNAYLVDESDNVCATLPMEAGYGGGTGGWGKRSRVEFFPTSGDHNYRVKLDQTAANSNLQLWCVRIIVVQANATKTRIQIPLFGMTHDASSNSDATTNGDGGVSTTYAQNDATNYGLWRKDSAQFASLIAGTPWTLECILTISNIAGTASAALFNATDGTQVTGAEVSVTGAGSTAPTFATASFANDAVNFDELDNYEIRVKTSSASYAARVYSAYVWVTLENLTKAEVVWRLGRKWVADTAVRYSNRQRMLYTASNYSNRTVYYEVCGYCSTDGDVVRLMNDTTLDDGNPTTGTDVTGSWLNFNSATKTRKRTSMLYLTSGERYFQEVADTTPNNYQVPSGFLVVRIDTTQRMSVTSRTPV